ncbi:titin homolog [Linepithema humile]|uniref:titin homolog n=1 Tax=Linepithema humile TaxID=83485 RepID=UPI00351EB2AC
MNYNGNMPDWHQYNPPQSGINDVSSTSQNISSGHFISSISPNCPPQLSSLNLSSEGLEKHQNDSNFNPRHFQPHLPSNISHGHNAVADNTPLASMAQMQNCIGHYGPSNTRNSMVDNLNGPMDPRSTAIGGLNEELGYRNNQVPLNGPISHHGPNVMNMNAPHGPIASRSTNVNSHATGRTGPPPSFAPCKALCCNPDPNISYQQYCSYQNNAAYRENIRSSAGYQADARRFGNDFSFRKDNFDGKDVPPPPPPPPSSMVPPHNVPNVDHRRNFSDPIKYRKDRLVSRGYPSASSMLQNYSMQNYNYAEYQKYPYGVKDYSKVGGMNVPSQGMVKQHGQEQGFAMPQQKYNSGKQQVPYQSNGGMMPSSMPSANVPPNPSMMSAAQNTYYNSQYPRNLSTETSHSCQEAADNVPMANRMPTSTMPHNTPHSRYPEFQQRLAMQRFSIENHLRKLSRIPDYQSLPEYKECVHKYNEIVNIERQQSFTYQGQMQQAAPCVAVSAAVNAPTVPPINLQFDRNGVLINSSYLPEAFRVQQVVNPPPVDSATADKQSKQSSKNITEMANHNVQKPEQMLPTQQHAAHAVVLCPEGIQQGKQDRYPAPKSLDQRQFQVPKAPGDGYSNLGANASDTAMQQKMPKVLDVRQFLANWDESEDEDGASANLPEAVLSDSTPVVVVGYENVDLSAKTLEDLNSSKPPEIASGVIAFENQTDKSAGSGGVVAAQDCLTISYAENAAEIAKDSACKELAKVRPGSHIIQCISNEPGEAPTIHIVDNLEIGSILQVANGQVAETQDAVSFFQEGTEVEASTIALEADKFKKVVDGSGGESSATALVDLASKEKYIVEDSSSSKAAENAPQPARVADQIVTLPASMKDNLDAAQDMNLKKQSSFASEESHNPDDISLPDLPTSECTPISTTLNTPIHSDNEESSEHVEDLTIPTNPIEIIQNSPMISFTQSPTKGEPYDHLSDEGTDRRSTDSLRGEYRTETRYKGDGSHDMLDHDTVLGTFEFSANIDESEAGATTKKNNKERASPRGSCVIANNNEKTFALNGETESVEVTGMRMTLTSGEYELKIVSTGAQSKPRDYKNSTNERHVNESEIAAAVSSDVSMTRKKLPLLPETCAKVTPGRRYDDSMELNNALQNITKDPIDCDQVDANYVERRCVSTDLTDQTNSASDAASRNSRSEDVCSTKIAKSNNPSTSHSTKRSNLSDDKLRKCESDKFAKEDSSLERNIDGDKSARTDAKNLKSFRHVKHVDYKKPASGDPAISHKKRYLSENTVEKCSGEATTHHDKHTQEADAHKVKLCAGDGPKESDVSRNKPKIIDNIRVDDSSERIRLLKEYRRIKYKSCSVGEKKGKDAQEASDCAASKKSHLSSNPDERSQSSKDKQLCQRDAARLKLSDEQEEKHANILRTFVTKNINPDFDIQVTNVNLKLNDNDHPRDLQCLREDAKNSGALDAIKIEINVSCSERNTTKTLLHENIKNAVAETIGHLTSTISNGARSNSTSITEIQCDKKVACDKVECCDYERSPATSREASTYNNEAYKDQDNAEVKHKSAITACAASEEPSNSLVSKKKRKSSSERDQINNIYDDNGNVNIETEPASSILETSETEHAAIRRRSVQQDAERKVAATNFCVNEESKISVDNSYMGSKNVQKMDHQEMTASLSRNARNSQDDIASRSNAIPSTSSSAANASLEDARYDNPVHFDYNHFDVAPNEHTDANDNDKRNDRWKRPKRDDGRFRSFDLYESSSGFINPTFFSADERENLNAVPVYTTKDGKITYSPNPRFTYRELIMEARAKESYGPSARDSYFARSPSYDYYNCSKLRKVFKRHRDVAAGRKRDIDSADAKPAAKHIDYSPSNNAAKTRDTSHLEFFNDANKLFASSRNGQQESKESNRKNIVDLSFLEKKYNNESASSVKHCKTFADNLGYEKGYNESSVFDTNLFLGPKSTCEETMESIKSYSSHIDRRNTDGLKEYNFSEIFAVQKRLDPFPFLPAQQNSSDNEHKANCDTANEPMLYHRAICSFADDLHVSDDDARCEKSSAVLHNEQESEINNQNDAVVISINNDKSADTPSASLNIHRNDEYLTRQESQSEEIKSSAVLAETPRPCSPKVVDEKIQDSERDQCSADYVKDNEVLAEHPDPEDDACVCSTVSSQEDEPNAEEAKTAKNVENTENAEYVENTENAENVETTRSCENSENAKESEKAEETEKAENTEKAEDSKQHLDEHIEVASLSELNVDGDLIKDSPDELKSAKTIEESAPPSNEQSDGINDSAKNNSDPAVDQEILHSEILPVSNNRKEEEEAAPAIELNISSEIDQTTNEQDNACDENSTVCQEKEPITSQNPSDVALMEQSLEEEGNEQELQKPVDEERTAEISLKDPGTDEVDNCNPIIISTPPPILDLQMARAEDSVCDLFANEKREQNISEFTVIKSIIKPDKKQLEELEAKEHLKDCDSIIDSKLLCMDSSDCGIYSEDRCTLVQISEHDFTEDDSMVPMEWETSQIQEDAVNRLCSIDESSIDFAGAASSLQDNSLLDNLSLSRASSTIKESAVAEKIMEMESKTNDESAAAIESRPTVEESKPSNDDDDGDREPDQVSSSNYEKVAYLRATDCNANTKMVPKLVIKKSEASSKFVTKLSASSSPVSPVNSKSSYQPKIPKMIIRNARSRPGTPSIPSIEAVHEEVSAQASISERSSLAADELYDNDSNQSSLQESSGHRNKIPKMKIKLDERHSSKIIAEDSTEVCAKRKNMKKTISKESRDPDRHEEKIPVLKLRKHERNRSSSPEGVTRKRQSSSHSDVPVKKCKRSGRDETGHSTRRSSSSDSTRTTASESEARKNPLVCISEKIPKVIIKRTSASAEFKCEFSKGYKSVIAKSAKWQPEVKLERYRILDGMVKDLKLTPISLRTIEKIFSSSKDRRQQEGDHKLSRSNSTSDLLPVKCKQRRMSDYDCRKASDALKSDLSFARDADVKNTKTCITPKKNVSSKNHSRPMDDGCPKDDRRRSRSRDNNPQAETDVTDKEMSQPFGKTGSAFAQHDECKISGFDVHHERAARVDKDRQENIFVKHSSNSTDFKIALKELKATSNMENCFVKLPDLSGPLSLEINLHTEKEGQKERDEDLFFGKSDSKNMIKKERLSSSSDIDCTLQDDIGLLKDDSAGMLDSFGINRNSIIKIESSDESQSTIEILPASPDDNNELESNIIEDGDSEQLYSADAIPTQFELELEIADNSNTDLLDVPMPKLDPISCYSSRRVSTEEPCGDQASKAGRCNTFESSSRGKNLLEKDKHVTANGRSALESDSTGSVRQISVISPCSRTAGSVATKENFCCNDSLIKEVLAAKETLKKCLSKSRCEESGARLKTVAEKKQGSSFDLNSLSETHSKSSNAPQGCRSDIAPQTASTPAAGKHKTESMPVEKSDKKHSKQSKSSCVKKKPKSPEKNDRANCREVTKSALESAISLKTFRRVGQAVSNESRTVYLSEKRKNSSDTPQLRDTQRKEGSKWSSYKIPKISKSMDRGRADGNAKENKSREDNMPILEPAIAMDLDSDRDSSRSPPVITIQDSEDLEITEAKLADDKIITSDDKVASDMKDVHKKSEMSTVDLISQLAYHEKATIKDKPYCNLCEREFDTIARYRRHLRGYQHSHMELTQRRSIHALFMLFTGKPCPRLLPAHIVRSDCSIGELTPLQIAVQDVTKCFDRTEQSPKKQNNVEK